MFMSSFAGTRQSVEYTEHVGATENEVSFMFFFL